jgi:CRP-like cAMP-binding protein
MEKADQKVDPATLKAEEKIKAWTPEVQVQFKTWFREIDAKMYKWEYSKKQECVKQLQKYADWKKKEDEKNRLTDLAIEVFKTSTRCQRSAMEKDILKKFMALTLTCVPFDKLSSGDIDRVCNEVDYIPCMGRSILFLQGDFGNVWYMVAKGRVALYLEPSKDKEMVIAREFGSLRGVPYTGTDQDLLRLGMNIFTVQTGNGFGEFAILNAKQKIRSCAAVAADLQSLCLILHADCYNAVMRKLHTRQRNITLANALLQELPLFKQFPFSKISSIAFTLKNQNHSNKATICKSGDKLDKLFLIISGEVRVEYPKSDLSAMHEGYRSKGVAMAEKMLPSLAIAQIGRGCIIGETEVQQGKNHFAMTYKVCSVECEVFEMPLAVYFEVLNSTSKNNEKLSLKLRSQITEREANHGGRVVRAYNRMKDMIMEAVDSRDAKETLNYVIPNILNVDPDAHFALSMSQNFKSGVTVSIPSESYSALQGLGVDGIENLSPMQQSMLRSTGQPGLVANMSQIQNSPRKLQDESSYITSSSNIRYTGSPVASPRPPQAVIPSNVAARNGAPGSSSSSSSPRKILFKE